jgi:hypothetical protein
MKHPELLLFLLLLPPVCALLLLAGCEITNEGMEAKEVVVEEIFPPSKTVSSYRQIAAPKQANEEALVEQFGGKDKLVTLRKWSSFATRVCEYGLPNQPPLMRVMICEMSTRLDSFGAFSNLRPAMLPENQYVKIGIQAVLDGDRLFFVHDRYLVIIRHLQKTTDEQRRALLLNFGRGVSRRIPRPMIEPTPLNYFPLQYRVPASERLDKEDPVGLAIVENGASALYRVGNRESRMFMAMATGTFRKLAFLDKYRKAMEAEGPVKEVQLGDGCYQGKLNKLSAMIAQREDVVFGILGTLEPDEMQEIMATADRLIKPYIPVKYNDVTKKSEEEEKDKGGGFGFGL